MLLMQGNMFTYPVDMILVTTNCFVKTDGRLVMGRGAAQGLLRLYPHIDGYFGDLLNRRVSGYKQKGQEYGVVIAPDPQTAPWSTFGESILKKNIQAVGPRHAKFSCDRILVGAFQVKYHWGNPAEIPLIEYSVECLKTILATSAYAGWKVSLNFPGIGNGQLKRGDVLPVIQGLPDNVIVWEK